MPRISVLSSQSTARFSSGLCRGSSPAASRANVAIAVMPPNCRFWTDDWAFSVGSGASATSQLSPCSAL